MQIHAGDLVEWSFIIYGNERATKRGRARIVEEGFVVIQNQDRTHGDQGGFHTMASSGLRVIERGHLSIIHGDRQPESAVA
jgi:hypothetical protein